MLLEWMRGLSFASQVSQPGREHHDYRALLGLGGALYLGWWFAVEWLLPGSFNPLPSRLAVVLYFLLTCALGFVFEPLKRHSETAFYVGAVILLAHYFYLFHHNAQDINWAVGAYVVVFALCVMVQSRAWLFGFSAFSFACGVVVWLAVPSLQRTIFLPGLATILALCLFVLLSRLRLLTNLLESADRYRTLLDSTFEGIAVYDRAGILDVNGAFVSLFGYSREELLGRSVLSLAAPELRERASSQLESARDSRYESVGLRKDGTPFAIEVSSKPYLYEGRSVRLAAVRDISERKRAEAERLALIQEQAARASAQEALRLRDEFISIASHELRTPITSLLLHLDGFARLPPADRKPQILERYSARARRQLNRMRRLVDALLDASRMEAGPLVLSKEQLDLESLVRQVVDSLSEELLRAECPLEIHVLGQTSGMWDRLRLEQVIENLLRNALIYGAGKPIHVFIRSDSGHAVLAVEDRGIGIERDAQEKIFERYERAVSSRNYGGLGLGLYISKQIVEAHLGSVRVESTPGQGSTFYVELPAHGSGEQTVGELSAGP
jgi:PAS domain S-box-containing protein